MRFFPDVMFDSAYEIPYEALYGLGYRVVLFDIDNTIVPHDAPATRRAKALFDRIRRCGLRTAIVSNNEEARVRSFAEAVGASYVHKAGKPKKAGFLRAMRMARGRRHNTFFVGDQIFTDILGANAAGLKTVLTKPIHPKERLQIVLKRYLEKPLIALFRSRVRKKGYTGAFARTVTAGKGRTHS